MFVVLGVLVFLRIWFGPGDVIRLKEDCIMKGAGHGSRKSNYEHIVSCCPQKAECGDATFTILKFTVKRGLPSGEIDIVAVPADVMLESVLQILRSKGVRIIDNPETPNNSLQPTATAPSA
jgi:hypothetical protein